jgi:ketosteroid isomerase-like protein
MTDSHAPQLPTEPGDQVAAYLATFAAGVTDDSPSGSADLLDRHYEPGAILVPKPGEPLTGPAQRIAAHAQLLGFGVPMRATTRHVYVAGDIALLVVDWSIRGTARQGFPLDLSGTAADVVRRDADGHWRYVIDNPFGTG